MRVLVVEDERLLADTITAGLRKHAMAVELWSKAVDEPWHESAAYLPP